MKELIIFNTESEKKEIVLIEDGEMVERYEEDENNQSIEGNIYIGKVQNVLNGLQSAFVNIGEKRTGFIHAKDILAKIDITKDKQIDEKHISEIVKPGDPIIVEVKRESLDKKGPRLSTHISLSSRFIVFMSNTNFITVSQKIENEAEKERLKKIVKKYLPEGSGAIIRTVAENVSEDIIKKDIQNSINKWEKIQLIPIEKVPLKIYDKGGILKKTIIDLVDSDIEKIILKDEENLKMVQDILEEITANIKIEVDNNILDKYSIEKQIQALKSNKIWLKSGAFITIDKTEALVAIDVNSGKYVGKNEVEETVTNVNLEATKEICKQIRLRDISGIIIIDFIDMQKDENKKRVLDELIKYTKKDRSKVQIEGFTKLNLMEITRKHINSKKEH